VTGSVGFTPTSIADITRVSSNADRKYRTLPQNAAGDDKVVERHRA
jgi:hypothetical protein